MKIESNYEILINEGWYYTFPEIYQTCWGVAFGIEINPTKETLN